MWPRLSKDIKHTVFMIDEVKAGTKGLGRWSDLDKNMNFRDYLDLLDLHAI